MIRDLRLRENNYWYDRAATPLIFFALGNTPEKVYGGMLDEVGAGGLETTYVQLAEALAAKHCTVFMFSKCDRPHYHHGVYWVPFEQYVEYQMVPDYVVTSRWFDSLYQKNVESAKKVIWIHDAHFADPNRPDAFTVANRVVCSSAWHRDYISERFGDGMPDGKLEIIPLSVDKATLAEPCPKIPRQVVYSSNPDRGLIRLLEMWPVIKEGIDGARLIVTYGWEGLETWGQDEQWVQQVRRVRDTCYSLAAAAGDVTFTGRLKKTDLYSIIKQSVLCLYSNNFPETFCLTAAECQLAGTPMITSDLGALSNIVDPACNVLIGGNPAGKRYEAQFISASRELLQNADTLSSLSLRCRLSAMHRFQNWDAVADRWLEMLWKL